MLQLHATKRDESAKLDLKKNRLQRNITLLRINISQKFMILFKI